MADIKFVYCFNLFLKSCLEVFNVICSASKCMFLCIFICKNHDQYNICKYANCWAKNSTVVYYAE